MCQDRIVTIIATHAGIPVAQVTPDSRLLDDLDLDSLDRIELAMMMEDEFRIQISDDDVNKRELGTVGGLITYIEGRIAAQAA